MFPTLGGLWTAKRRVREGLLQAVGAHQATEDQDFDAKLRCFTIHVQQLAKIKEAMELWAQSFELYMSATTTLADEFSSFFENNPYCGQTSFFSDTAQAFAGFHQKMRSFVQPAVTRLFNDRVLQPTISILTLVPQINSKLQKRQTVLLDFDSYRVKLEREHAAGKDSSHPQVIRRAQKLDEVAKRLHTLRSEILAAFAEFELARPLLLGPEFTAFAACLHHTSSLTCDVTSRMIPKMPQAASSLFVLGAALSEDLKVERTQLRKQQTIESLLPVVLLRSEHGGGGYGGYSSYSSLPPPLQQTQLEAAAAAAAAVAAATESVATSLFSAAVSFPATAISIAADMALSIASSRSNDSCDVSDDEGIAPSVYSSAHGEAGSSFLSLEAKRMLEEPLGESPLPSPQRRSTYPTPAVEESRESSLVRSRRLHRPISVDKSDLNTNDSEILLIDEFDNSDDDSDSNDPQSDSRAQTATGFLDSNNINSSSSNSIATEADARQYLRILQQISSSSNSEKISAKHILHVDSSSDYGLNFSHSGTTSAVLTSPTAASAASRTYLGPLHEAVFRSDDAVSDDDASAGVATEAVETAQSASNVNSASDSQFGDFWTPHQSPQQQEQHHRPLNITGTVTATVAVAGVVAGATNSVQPLLAESISSTSRSSRLRRETSALNRSRSLSPSCTSTSRKYGNSSTKNNSSSSSSSKKSIDTSTLNTAAFENLSSNGKSAKRFLRMPGSIKLGKLMVPRSDRSSANSKERQEAAEVEKLNEHAMEDFVGLEDVDPMDPLTAAVVGLQPQQQQQQQQQQGQQLLHEQLFQQQLSQQQQREQESIFRSRQRSFSEGEGEESEPDSLSNNACSTSGYSAFSHTPLHSPISSSGGVSSNGGLHQRSLAAWSSGYTPPPSISSNTKKQFDFESSSPLAAAAAATIETPASKLDDVESDKS